MKKLLIFMIAFIPFSSIAQDKKSIVTLKNGTEIKGIVKSINPTDELIIVIAGIETTIKMNDVARIEEDIREIASKSNSIIDNKTEYDYGFLNDGLISNINDRSVNFQIEKTNKKAKWLYRLVKIHTESEMINKDAKLSIKLDHDPRYIKKAGIFVEVENNTDEILFFDLGSCFFRIKNRASSYYSNSSTTRTTGSGFGWSYSNNIIGNILGIKGSIFNRNTFGGGVFSSKSTTVYEERIVAIAPHTKYRLPLKIFYDPKREEPYKTDFKIGERHLYKQPEKFDDSPWEIILSYANESDIDKMKRLRVAMYIAEEISINSIWDYEDYEEDLSPLHYYYKLKN